MAAPRLRKSLSKLKRRRKAGPVPQQNGEQRVLQLESLEDRRLMAQGPALVAVIPNNGVFLQNNVTLNVAPRDLTFRFAQGNVIDPATLSNGIRIVRAGVDGVFDAPNAPTPNDISIQPGFIGLGDTPREVVMRFAANLPDDLYRVTLVGAGLTPLKDANGDPFNGGVDQSLNFRLDLGTKVEAIVPQPITRGVNNVLAQSNNTIEVYFDQSQLST